MFRWALQISRTYFYNVHRLWNNWLWIWNDSDYFFPQTYPWDHDFTTQVWKCGDGRRSGNYGHRSGSGMHDGCRCLATLWHDASPCKPVHQHLLWKTHSFSACAHFDILWAYQLANWIFSELLFCLFWKIYVSTCCSGLIPFLFHNELIIITPSEYLYFPWQRKYHEYSCKSTTIFGGRGSVGVRRYKRNILVA